MHECEICGNEFEIELKQEGGDFNDFGYRYCPFCGQQYDTLIMDNPSK
jgi:hypothetical protein